MTMQLENQVQPERQNDANVSARFSAPDLLSQNVRELTANKITQSLLSLLPSMSFTESPSGSLPRVEARAGKPNEPPAEQTVQSQGLGELLKNVGRERQDNKVEPTDKVNNLAKIASDEILKDGKFNTLEKQIAMGAAAKETVDEVNKALEKAGSPLRVKLHESSTIVCGPGKLAGTYPNVFISLVGKDGKVIQTANPINPFKNGTPQELSR